MIYHNGIWTFSTFRSASQIPNIGYARNLSATAFLPRRVLAPEDRRWHLSMSEVLNKILYVEDDHDIAMVAKLTLEAIGGFTVLHCYSGQEALDIFPDFDPQLVLVDVMMPQMDGMQTLANLRLIPKAKDIPVIFMTARAQTHEQAAYFDLGALGVVVKPFDPMTLSNYINELWGKWLSGQPSIQR